jgi:hypothetical protein
MSLLWLVMVGIGTQKALAALKQESKMRGIFGLFFKTSCNFGLFWYDGKAIMCKDEDT